MSTLHAVERRLLGRSMTVSLVLALLGFAIAHAATSQTVFFDALYSIAGLLTTGIGLLLIGHVHRRSAAYPLGKYGYEPLYNVLQGLALLAVCLYGIWEGLHTLGSGGRDVELGLASLYALAALAATVWMSRVLGPVSRRVNSPILHVEAAAYRMDALVSVGVAVAMLGGALLQTLGYHTMARYVDPLLVVAVMTIAIATPLAIVRDNARDLLYRAPDAPILDAVVSRIDEATNQGPWTLVDTRVIKYGRRLFVTVNLAVPASLETLPLAKLHALTRRVRRAVRGYWPGADVDINLDVTDLPATIAAKTRRTLVRPNRPDPLLGIHRQRGAGRFQPPP